MIALKPRRIHSVGFLNPKKKPGLLFWMRKGASALPVRYWNGFAPMDPRRGRDVTHHCFLPKQAGMRCARSLPLPWQAPLPRPRLKPGLPALISHQMRQWKCIAAPCGGNPAPCCVYWTLPPAGAVRRNWKKRRGWKPWAAWRVGLRMISTICSLPLARRRKRRWHAGRMPPQPKICAKYWIVQAAARDWCVNCWPLPAAKQYSRAWWHWTAPWMAWPPCSRGFWAGVSPLSLILNAPALAPGWTQAILTRR